MHVCSVSSVCRVCSVSACSVSTCSICSVCSVSSVCMKCFQCLQCIQCLHSFQCLQETLQSLETGTAEACPIILMEYWAEKQTSYLNNWPKESASMKWDGQTTGWLHTMLSLAILRATNPCLRGSCQVELGYMMQGCQQSYQALIIRYNVHYYIT